MSEAPAVEQKGSPRRSGTVRKSIYVTGGSLAGVGLGFAFQILLARALGVSQAADVYSLGTMFPTLVATVFIGSSPSVLVPAFHRQLESHGVTSYRILVWPSVAILTVAVLTALVNLLCIPWLTSTLDAANAADLYIVTVISSLAMPLSWVTAVGTSILLAQEKFLLVGLSGALNGAALLVSSAAGLLIGASVVGLAWAFIGGYLVQAVVFGGVLFRAAWAARRRSEKYAAQGITIALLALLVSALIYKSQPLIERSLASSFEGGPAAFNYASKLAQAVLMGSTLGLSMISLPSISRKISAGDTGQGWEVATRVSTLISVFAAPLSVTGMLMAADVVRTIYGTSSFSSSEVQTISLILSVSLLGVLFSSLTGPTVNYLYAIGFYRRVAAISIGTTVIGGLVSAVGAQVVGLGGIAIGSSFAFLVNYLTYTMIARHHARARWSSVMWRQLFIVACTLPAAWIAKIIVESLAPEDFAGGLSRVAVVAVVTCVVAIGAYVIVREKSANPLLGTR